MTDIGLPPALLDPRATIDSVVSRHPELAAEFDGLMAPPADTGGGRDRAAEVRRAALVSKVLLNVFATGAGGPGAGRGRRPEGRAAGRLPGDVRRGLRPAGLSRRIGSDDFQ